MNMFDKHELSLPLFPLWPQDQEEHRMDKASPTVHLCLWGHHVQGGRTHQGHPRG